MGQMANAAKVKTGSFIGDGTRNITLDIGFEPDGIIITSGLDYTTSGWMGYLTVVMIRGVMVMNFCHTSATVTNYTSYQYAIKATDDPWAVNTGSYRPIGEYVDGKMNISNATGSPYQVFVNNQTYSWTAYKA